MTAASNSNTNPLKRAIRPVALQHRVDGHLVNRLDDLLPWAWKWGNPVKP
jgi:hypothetical protein